MATFVSPQHQCAVVLTPTFPTRSFPDRRDFKHAEGNSAAHLKSSAIGASETIPVAGGTMALGTWQGIYFCEFDGPRHRKVCVQVVGE